MPQPSDEVEDLIGESDVDGHDAAQIAATEVEQLGDVADRVDTLGRRRAKEGGKVVADFV
jgi:hypothetical protein